MGKQIWILGEGLREWGRGRTSCLDSGMCSWVLCRGLGMGLGLGKLVGVGCRKGKGSGEGEWGGMKGNKYRLSDSRERESCMRGETVR